MLLPTPSPDRPNTCARQRHWAAPHAVRVRVRRVSATLTCAIALLMIAGTAPASAATTNPFKGVTPDMGLFGPALNNTWTRVLGATWAACLAYCGWRWVAAAATVRSAKSRGAYGDVAQGKEELVGASWALGCVACAGVIVGAVLFIATGDTNAA